jgi:hypothetical protein
LSWAAAGLVLALAGGLGAQALAAKPFVPGTPQPTEEQVAPKPDEAKPAEQPKCIAGQSGFKNNDNKPTFEVALENSCDARIKCTVDVYVLGARGPVQGRTTMVLGPAAKGQTTRKVYVLKVKSAGGMASMSQDCKKI